MSTVVPINWQSLLCDISTNPEANQFWENMREDHNYQELICSLLEQEENMKTYWPPEQVFNPLHRCARSDSYTMLCYTLVHYSKVDPNTVDHDGDTALHGSAALGQTGIMEVLLKGGAKAAIDNKNNEGNTALHRAALSGMTEAVSCLLHYGASTQLLNNEGYTPIRCAAKECHTDVVSQLHGYASPDEVLYAMHMVICIAAKLGDSAVAMFRLLVSWSTREQLDAHTHRGKVSVSERVVILQLHTFQDIVESRQIELDNGTTTEGTHQTHGESCLGANVHTISMLSFDPTAVKTSRDSRVATNTRTQHLLS